jgi:putative selenium metabolism hydrolase
MIGKELEARILADVEGRRTELVNLTRELVRTPSLSGQEKEVAALISDRMKGLGYDSVEIDEVGNAVGVIGGKAEEGTLMFNGHMDHVPPGDMPDPYSAAIKDGSPFGVSGEVIVGRAASDMKGALAAMIMAGAALQDLNLPLKRRLVVAAVVLEETNGLGSRYLTEMLPRPGGVVIGESTNLDVALGHRGSIGAAITTEGVSCHASAPERGINALYKMIPVLEEIKRKAQDLPSHPALGKSSMVATTISVSPNIKNVLPNLCTVGLDIRNTPDFKPEDILETLHTVVRKAQTKDSELRAKVELQRRKLRCYTGYEREIESATPAFYTDQKTPLAQMTKAVAERVLKEEKRFKVWTFATDGCYFSNQGIPTVGFGPGEERFAHSPTDNIRTDDLVASAKVYATLAAEFCQ